MKCLVYIIYTFIIPPRLIYFNEIIFLNCVDFFLGYKYIADYYKHISLSIIN